jgi:MFS family permease
MSVLGPLRHRAFAMFWAAAFVSNIGTWMETVALASEITESTGRSVWAAVIAAAGFVPTAFLGPLGGALADRRSRRAVLMITTAFQVAVAVTLAVLFLDGTPSPATVTALVFVNGCAAALGFPAYQAMIPDLVPAEELVAAVGLGSAQFNLGRVIGPALAGVVIALGGVSLALMVNAASFFAVLGVLAVLRLPRRVAPHDGTGVIAAIVSGARVVRAEPALWLGLQMLMVVSFVVGPFIALVAAMATQVHGGDAGTTSLLVTAQGAGAVVTALSLAPVTARLGVRRVVGGSLVAQVPCLVAYGIAPTPWLAAGAVAVLSGVYIAAIISASAIAQQRAPKAFRGRVLSLNMLTLGAMYPVGALLQGWLADAVGLRSVTVGSAVVLALVLVAVRVGRPGCTAVFAAAPATAAASA